MATSPGRLTYRVENGLLILTAVGAPTSLDRRETFQAIREDARVPERAPLLLDTRELTNILTSSDGPQRLTELVTGLGSNMRHVCAVLASGSNPLIIDGAYLPLKDEGPQTESLR